MSQHTSISAVPDDPAGFWANIVAARPRRLDRPRDVPRPESIEEVSRWAGNEDLRRTELVHAPVFWVLLPLAALGYLIWGTITDPGEGWTGNLFDDANNGQLWNFWLVWVGVAIWLLITVGVLLFRLSVLRDLRAENEWVFEHGVAHSIHRASVDYDNGEGSWATYIALDHRLDDQQAARIHAAFEQWVSETGIPPARSKPISSQSLFGAQAAGGRFILHLPVSTTAGATTDHEWMLITEPRDDESDVIMTPVPVPKKLARIRRRIRRKAERRGAS